MSQRIGFPFEKGSTVKENNLKGAYSFLLESTDPGSEGACRSVKKNRKPQIVGLQLPS